MSGTEEEDLMADAWAAALEEQVTAEAKPAPLEELKDDAPISAEEASQARHHSRYSGHYRHGGGPQPDLASATCCS